MAGSAAGSIFLLICVGLFIAMFGWMLTNFRAYQISKEFYWACKGLKVPRFLQEQLLRASSSVALNVSEASGRRTPADKRRHYTIAYGSLQECRTIMELERLEKPEVIKMADELAAILYSLSRERVETKQQKDKQ